MRTRIRRLATLLLASLVAAVMTGPTAVADAPQQVGRWLGPFSEDGAFDAAPPGSRAESARSPVAVNVVVLPDDRVLYWSQLEGTESVDRSISFQLPEGARSRSRLLDLSAYVSAEQLPGPSAFTVPTPEHAPGDDMVGSEQRHLPDGRVLAVGGTVWSNEDQAAGLPDGMGRTELYGSPDARVFDPRGAGWSAAARMHRARYYPSMVTLPDGRMLVVGGADRLIYDSALFGGPNPSPDLVPQLVHEVETYDPATGTWTLNEAPAGRAALPSFAHLHLMPDGSVFYPGAGMFFPPGGGDRDAAAWNFHHTYDPASGAWRTGESIPLGARSNAFSVMLPLEPPYDEASILVGGGTSGPWPGTLLGTALSELVRWRDGSASRAMTGPMNGGRWHGSAVLLPTGEVIALSGADRDEVVDPGSGIPVRHADMFDPGTGRWVRLAEATRGRTLHNTAVLLRDGSILVGGHSPAPAHYGSHTQNPPPLSSNYKDPSFEIFRPPALFRGPRPVIDAVSVSSIAHGATVRIETRQATDPTLRVVFSRLPSTTHVIDNDQRAVVASHTVEGTSVAVTIPPGAVLPPGHYYVFLVTDTDEGATFSIGEVVRIG